MYNNHTCNDFWNRDCRLFYTKTQFKLYHDKGAKSELPLLFLKSAVSSVKKTRTNKQMSLYIIYSQKVISGIIDSVYTFI